MTRDTRTWWKAVLLAFLMIVVMALAGIWR